MFLSRCISFMKYSKVQHLITQNEAFDDLCRRNSWVFIIITSFPLGHRHLTCQCSRGAFTKRSQFGVWGRPFAGFASMSPSIERYVTNTLGCPLLQDSMFQITLGTSRTQITTTTLQREFRGDKDHDHDPTDDLMLEDYDAVYD